MNAASSARRRWLKRTTTMTNTNEIRVATESWVNSSIKKEFDPIDINDVYAAFEAGANWQSQQAQGEVVAYQYRFTDPISGTPLWRFDAGPWNAQNPKASRPLYA